MNTVVSRIYNIRDDKLTMLASVTRDHYIQYQASFNSFNEVIFPPDYQDITLATKLEAAKATISDAFVVKSQAKETADVQDAKKELLRPLKILSFVVDTSFDDNPTVHDEFMLNQLSAKAQNVDTLIGFTKDTLNTVERYKEKLIEGGLKQDLIGIIKQACEKLDNQRREQIEIIKSRPGITLERVEKMNALWKELVKMNRAAEIIFELHPEVRDLFDLPKASRHAKEEDEQPVVARSGVQTEEN